MAGIYLNKISSEKANKGDTIMTVYSSNPISQAVIKSLEDNIEYLAKPKTLPPIIYKVLHN
jgi:thymidine phosphorylase